MEVVDVTGQTCEGYRGKPLILDNVSYLIIHRCDLHQRTPANPQPILDSELTGAELARRFRKSTKAPPDGLGTYGRIPYHCVIDMHATVTQILPLWNMGAHAVGYNWRSWGVTVVGDCDERPPTDEQWEALVSVCASLFVWNRGLQIVGHTSLPGASADPQKRCPGRYISLEKVGSEAQKRAPFGWQGVDPGIVKGWLLNDGWKI